jgi:hypothetical protein
MQAATRAHDNYIKDGGGYGRMEMDTHADTCLLGINFVILEYSGRVCDVYPYSQDYEAINVQGATAVQDQDTGETFILVIHEGLWYDDRMHHSLINPNQLRHFQIDVCDNPYDKGGMHITDPVSKVSIPLLSKGTIVYADSHAPSEKELQTCRYVIMTSPGNWKPSTVTLGQVVTTEIDQEGFDLQAAYELGDRENLINSDSFYLSYISTVYGDYEFKPQVKQITRISSIDVPPIMIFISKKDSTTQTFSRNDRMFYQKYRNHQFAADLYMACTKSLHGNTCAYIFAHKSGFAQAYPQVNKTKSADSLKQFSIYQES